MFEDVRQAHSRRRIKPAGSNGLSTDDDDDDDDDDDVQFIATPVTHLASHSVYHYTVKPVLSDHIKQDIFLGFSDRWLLIAA